MRQSLDFDCLSAENGPLNVKQTHFLFLKERAIKSEGDLSARKSANCQQKANILINSTSTKHR